MVELFFYIFDSIFKYFFYYYYYWFKFSIETFYCFDS